MTSLLPVPLSMVWLFTSSSLISPLWHYCLGSSSQLKLLSTVCVCARVFYRTHYNYLWVRVYHLLPAHVPISPSEWRGGWVGGIRIQMLGCVWHWETGTGRSCGGRNSLQFTSRFLQQVARVVWCGDICPAWSHIQGVRTCSGWQALQKHRRAADWWGYQQLSFDYDWFGCNLVHESLFF